MISENSHRYLFQPEERPSIDLTDASSNSPLINYEQLEFSGQAVKFNHSSANDRILIEDEPFLEKNSDHIVLNSEFQDKKQDQMSEIIEIKKQPILLTPQFDNEHDKHHEKNNPDSDSVSPINVDLPFSSQEYSQDELGQTTSKEIKLNNHQTIANLMFEQKIDNVIDFENENHDSLSIKEEPSEMDDIKIDKILIDDGQFFSKEIDNNVFLVPVFDRIEKDTMSEIVEFEEQPILLTPQFDSEQKSYHEKSNSITPSDVHFKRQDFSKKENEEEVEQNIKSSLVEDENKLPIKNSTINNKSVIETKTREEDSLFLREENLDKTAEDAIMIQDSKLMQYNVKQELNDSMQSNILPPVVKKSLINPGHKISNYEHSDLEIENFFGQLAKVTDKKFLEEENLDEHHKNKNRKNGFKRVPKQKAFDIDLISKTDPSHMFDSPANLESSRAAIVPQKSSTSQNKTKIKDDQLVNIFEKKDQDPPFNISTLTHSQIMGESYNKTSKKTVGEINFNKIESKMEHVEDQSTEKEESIILQQDKPILINNTNTVWNGSNSSYTLNQDQEKENVIKFNNTNIFLGTQMIDNKSLNSSKFITSNDNKEHNTNNHLVTPSNEQGENKDKFLNIGETIKNGTLVDKMPSSNATMILENENEETNLHPREKVDAVEIESIRTTIDNFVEETTAFTISDEIGREKENLQIEEEETTTQNTQGEIATTTRRLPDKYVSSTKKKETITTKAPPKIINHNMNLQTALIINTLSKVLPNVPQSRLKNQPRLENVGSGVTFHQEELFIFHSTLTELQAILDKSLRRGGLPSDLMISIFAAKEHNLALVHLFYKLLLKAEFRQDKSITISQQDSRTFAKHFHFLRAIFPFL